jgi:hypothetical protein
LALILPLPVQTVAAAATGRRRRLCHCPQPLSLFPRLIGSHLNEFPMSRTF